MYIECDKYVNISAYVPQTAHPLLIIMKSAGRKQHNKEKRNKKQLTVVCRSCSGQTRLGVVAHKVDILTIFRSEMSCLLKYILNKSCFCLPFSLKLSKPAGKRKTARSHVQ